MKSIIICFLSILFFSTGLNYGQTPLSISGIHETVVRYIDDNGTYQYNMNVGTFNDDIGYHANSYYGLENTYRTEYRYPLSSIPPNATITSAKLQYSLSDFGVTDYFAVCKLSQAYIYQQLWDAIQNSPLLFSYLSYNGGETSSTQALIDAVNAARSTGYLYLGAASQHESNNQSYAKLELTLKLIYTVQITEVSLTAQNNFTGGRIYVDDMVNDVVAPHTFTKNIGENVTLKAKEQIDNLGYNRIWNDVEAPNAISQWTKNDADVSPLLEYSFQATQSDNNAIYEAELRKLFNINRNLQTEENSVTELITQIVEQNSGQISTPTQQTVNGRIYNFAGWFDGETNNTRNITPVNNETYTALYKLPHYSNQIDAFSNNSSRKFMRTEDGFLHLLYASMQKIWYEISTDGGNTWLLMNNGFPLNDNEAKNPSIDYYSNNVAIVYQENNNGNYKIQLHLFGASGNTYIQTATATVAEEITEEYTSDANPVIAYGYNGKAIICWETKTILNEGLKFMGASIGYGTISFYNATGFGDGYSTSPTIVTDKTYQTTNYFNLAWSQGNPSNDNSEIYYYDLYFDNNNNILKRTTSPEIPSANCGYEKNYKPSITYLVQSNGQNAKLEWIGERNSEEEFEKSTAMAVEKNAIFKSRDGLNWYYYTWAFGNAVQSVSINRSENTGYVIAWSQKPGSTNENKFVKNTSFSSIKTFNTTGKDIQVNNGTSFNNMYCNSFPGASSPYSFTLSQSVGSIQKDNSVSVVSSGREGVINRDSAAIYFALGDIEVNNEKVEFIEITGNSPITNFEQLNQNLVSEEFTLTDNAHFSYSVQYGVLHKGESPSLSGNEYVKFTVLLIDALTNEVIGLYDEVEYNTNNLGLYENILYEVDVTGIGNRQVRLKLVVTGNITAQFNVTTRIADESIIAKGSSRNLHFQGSLAVTEYALEQNYPNPFNPVTTIRYQIPKAGRVMLKVYDILGKEITTLVNEEKETGRYTVNFDASNLSSGVYLYELVANDYRAVKKLMAIK